MIKKIFTLILLLSNVNFLFSSAEKFEFVDFNDYDSEDESVFVNLPPNHDVEFKKEGECEKEEKIYQVFLELKSQKKFKDIKKLLLTIKEKYQDPTNNPYIVSIITQLLEEHPIAYIFVHKNFSQYIVHLGKDKETFQKILNKVKAARESKASKNKIDKASK